MTTGGLNPYYTQNQINQYPPPSPYVVSEQDNFAAPQNQYPPQRYPNQPKPQYPPNRNDLNNNPYSAQAMNPNIMIVDVRNVSPGPQLTYCRHCQIPTPTYFYIESGAFVWIMCFILLLLTCFCWCLAFWVDSWKDTVYRCTRCNNIKAIRQGGC